MNPSSSFSLPCTSSSYMMTMMMTLASTALIGSWAHSSPLMVIKKKAPMMNKAFEWADDLVNFSFFFC